MSVHIDIPTLYVGQKVFLYGKEPGKVLAIHPQNSYFNEYKILLTDKTTTITCLRSDFTLVPSIPLDPPRFEPGDYVYAYGFLNVPLRVLSRAQDRYLVLNSKTKYQNWIHQDDLSRVPKEGIYEPKYKSRPDLIPSAVLQRLGDLLGWGLNKYPTERWKELSIDDHYSALLRHLFAYRTSKDEPDSESGFSHTIHALARLS